MLIVDKITKSIQAKEIVKDCSLSVQAGQICGLAGPNGAGKTTLLNCIAGVLTPEAGRIELDGKDLIHEPLNRKALFLISEDFDEGQFFTIRQMKEFYSMFYQLDEETFAQHLRHFQLEEKLRISSLSKRSETSGVVFHRAESGSAAIDDRRSVRRSGLERPAVSYAVSDG